MIQPAQHGIGKRTAVSTQINVFHVQSPKIQNQNFSGWSSSPVVVVLVCSTGELSSISTSLSIANVCYAA